MCLQGKRKRAAGAVDSKHVVWVPWSCPKSGISNNPRIRMHPLTSNMKKDAQSLPQACPYLDDVRELLQARCVGEQPRTCGNSRHWSSHAPTRGGTRPSTLRSLEQARPQPSVGVEHALGGRQDEKRGSVVSKPGTARPTPGPRSTARLVIRDENETPTSRSGPAVQPQGGNRMHRGGSGERLVGPAAHGPTRSLTALPLKGLTRKQ